MPSPIDHGHTLHTLNQRGQPLGVECSGCGRRAFAFADRLADLRGDMTTLRSLRLVCSSCGSRAWSGWLFVDQADRDSFAGAAGGRPAF